MLMDKRPNWRQKLYIVVVVVSNALDIHDDSMTAAIDYIFEMASIKDKYVHKLIYLIVVMPYFNRHPYWLRYAS